MQTEFKEDPYIYYICIKWVLSMVYHFIFFSYILILLDSKEQFKKSFF